MSKDTKKTLHEKLSEIQRKLKAPKSQYNEFSKFYYRNCEDILEAVKPFLDGYVILLEDEIVQIGDRFYVKATAKFGDGELFITNSAFARESLDKKGMDDAQITGSTSSYARKYALNGLLLIDDTKDSDNRDNRPAKPAATAPAVQNNTPASEKQLKYLASLVYYKGVNEEDLKTFYKIKSYKELTASKASSIIAILEKRPNKPKAPVKEVSTPDAAEQPKPTAAHPPVAISTAQKVAKIMDDDKLTPQQKTAEMQKILKLKTGADLEKDQQEKLPVEEKK